MKQVPFSISFDITSPHTAQAYISVDAVYFKKIFNNVLQAQQKTSHISGFDEGKAPLSYIEKNYTPSLLKTCYQFLLNYGIIEFLLSSLNQHHMVIAGQPTLQHVDISDDKHVVFIFKLITWPFINLYNWKLFPFKAPKRKNYKDIDRQVHSFIKEEESKTQQSSIQPGDWVGFYLSVIDEDSHAPLLKGHKEHKWLRIGDEEADNALKEHFVDKKINDQFITNADSFQQCFHASPDKPYFFECTITHRVPFSNFSFEDFKSYFNLVNKKELHNKLIEVFSFRNDISQRRATMEDTLKLLVNKHSFSVPYGFIEQQEQKIVDRLRSNPDYTVYKSHSLFKEHTKKLAEKQIKEELLIDQIAYQENIAVEHADIQHYLNLTQRPRMRDYLYFDLPNNKVDGQEIPFCSEIIARECRREKTLNYIIHHLTKPKSV